MVRIYSKNHTVFCPYRIIQAPECVLPDSKVAFRCCREILCSQFRYFGCFKHQNVLFIEMAWTCSGLYLKLFQWYTDEAFIFSANAAQTVSNTSSIMYVQSDILERPSKGQQQIVVTSLISCKHSLPMDGISFLKFRKKQTNWTLVVFFSYSEPAVCSEQQLHWGASSRTWKALPAAEVGCFQQPIEC